MGIKTLIILLLFFLTNFFAVQNVCAHPIDNQVSENGNYALSEASESQFFIDDPSLQIFEIGLFFGFVLILLVYSFLIYINIKQPVFLWFFLYTLVVSLYLIESNVVFVTENELLWKKIMLVLSGLALVSFKFFFQWVLLTKSQFPVLHKWMNWGVFFGLMMTCVHVLLPDSYLVLVVNRLVVMAIVIIVVYCLIKDRELSSIQFQLLMVSITALLLSGASLSIFHVQSETSDFFQVLGFMLMVVHILTYSISVLFRIKRLTDKKEQLWQEIRESKNELLQSYFNGVEEERKRITTDLEDEVIHEFESVKNEISKLDSHITSFANDLENDIKLATEEIGLKSKAESTGLIHNLEQLVVDHNSNSTSFDFKHFNYLNRLPDVFENHLFRIVQEAVQNVEKYARAKFVEIQLYQDEKNLVLTIEDDGVGFDMNKKKNGIGLLNMKHRADQMQAAFHIASSVGKGVSILVNINMTDEL